MKPSTISLVIRKRKWDALHSKAYAAAVEYSPLLNAPRFAAKETQAFNRELTYRKINDWDGKGLVSGSRKREATGWRKFSLVDLIKFQVILDLRELGYATGKIQEVLGKIAEETVETVNRETGETEGKSFRQLEYYLFTSLAGEKTLLFIYPGGDIIFSREEDAVLYHMALFEDARPLLILPFHAYVQKLLEHEKLKEDPSLQALLRKS